MASLDAVSFLTPGALGAAIEVTVASIASPTELNSRAAAQGDIILARTVEAGTGTQTWYYADTTSDSEALPWIVSSATAGVKFIAIAGAYSNTANVKDASFAILGSSDATKTLKFEVDAQSAGADLTIDTGAQTADRTATFPVLTGNSILTLSNSTLTTTRVPFATTNGILTDSADMTFASGALTLGDTTGTNLIVSSTAASATRASNAIYTAGGIGVDGSISVDGDGSNVCLYMTPNTALFRCTTANATDTGYFDFSRYVFRDPSNGFATTFQVINNAVTVAATTGTTFIVSSTNASAMTNAGGTVNAGRVVSTGATAGVGYATGAGGTVAQGSGSGKATTVVLNTVCGTITMDGATLNADTTVAFTFTNSAIAATDLVVMQHSSVGTLGAYNFAVTPGAGTATVSVRNVTPGNLSEAIVIRFAIIKAVTA